MVVVVLVVLVVVVVVDHMSVHATKRQAPNYGGRVPVDTTPGPVPVHRALKIPTLTSPCQSTSTAKPRTLKNGNCGTSTVFCTLNRICRCTQRACNNNVQAGTRRTATVTTNCNCGISTDFSHPAPEESAGPAHRDVERLVSELQLWNIHGPQNSLDHGKLPLRHDKDDELHNLCNRDTDNRGNLCCLAGGPGP